MKGSGEEGLLHLVGRQLPDKITHCKRIDFLASPFQAKVQTVFDRGYVADDCTKRLVANLHAHLLTRSRHDLG